jgi:hypothetical protein
MTPPPMARCAVLVERRADVCPGQNPAVWALCAHTKAPYKTNLLWKTRRPLNHSSPPGPWDELFEPTTTAFLPFHCPGRNPPVWNVKCTCAHTKTPYKTDLLGGKR